MNSQPPLPNNEIARLNALRQYQILDTAPEKALDDVTFLAAQICGTPIALISLVDGSRQWFKSRVGLAATETSRDLAFCAYTILQQKPFIVRNALADPRFATNALVTSDPNIRFYAGAPLITPEGFALGSLCVIDTVPRDLSLEQVEALRALSRQTIAQFELRRNVISLSHTISQRQQAAEQLRRQHDFIEVFYHRGVDKARRGDYRGAIVDFNQFLQVNPNGVKAYYDRGLARRQLGDNKGAMADFDVYLRVNPNDAEARCNRGLVRAELGDYKGAIADYSQAMHSNPDYAVNYYNSGLGNSILGDGQEVTAYTQSLPLSLDAAEADTNFGNGHSELGQPEVIIDYTRSLPLDLDNAEANISSVNANSNFGEQPGKLVNYTQTLRLKDATVISSDRVRSILEDYQEAIEDYTQSLQLNPNDTEAYINRGNARSELKDYHGAIEDYTQSLRLNPNDAEAYISRGDARSELKDYHGAIEDYTQSLRLNPTNAKAYINRGDARSELKDYYGAIEDYTQSLQLNPSDAKAFISRGNARSELKDYQGAMEDYTQGAGRMNLQSVSMEE